LLAQTKKVVIDGIEPSLRVLLTLASPLGHMTLQR
jgi:hypothetical protein